MAGTLEIPVVGEPVSTGDPKFIAGLKAYNESLDTSNKLEAKSLSAGALGRWYTPVSIATTQERENVAFGTLTTADEVKSVVLPENGIIMVAYKAIAKSSVAGAGKAAIFLGANQLKTTGSTIPVVQEMSTSGTSEGVMGTTGFGLANQAVGTSFVTTGETLATGGNEISGFTPIRAAAGTYNISVQFKATSGKITVKERTLWVGVIGV